MSPRLSPRRLGPIRSPCWSCSSCWCDHVRGSQSSRGVFLQFFIRLRHLHQSRSAQRVYRHETLRRAPGVVPLPLARGGFFALSCGCPAGAQVLLLLALAVALVSWPLAWMLQLEVPPGWRWLVSWPMLARFVPRAVFGLGRGQQRPSWPALAGPRPGAAKGHRCPQCLHSSNSSGPHHPSHSHARGWQGMCGLLGSTWRGTQWLAAAIGLCHSIACMASFPANRWQPQGAPASFRTRYPKRVFLKGGF